MNHTRPLTTNEIIHYWKEQRDKILQELARRIESNESPEHFQQQVKARYEMIQATIRFIEQNYRPDVLQELKNQLEFEERGYVKPSSRMLDRAFQTA
jgi:hypothetical protein